MSAPTLSPVVAAAHGLVAERLHAVAGSGPPPIEAVGVAFAQALADRRAWTPEATPEALLAALRANGVDLVVLLYRLGRHLAVQGGHDAFLPAIHGLMRAAGACEVYFNTEIGEGFRIVHGLGSVVGSRHVIGRRFTLHHGCTVGHLTQGAVGCRIGDDVTLYAGASILGPVSMGDGAVLAAHALLLDDAAPGAVMIGAPARSGAPR